MTKEKLEALLGGKWEKQTTDGGEQNNMYRVRIHAKNDFLGEIVDRFNVKVEALNMGDAQKEAETIACKENCQRYGMPVHFTAVACKLMPYTGGAVK